MRDEPFLHIHMTLPDKTSLGELILSAYENRIALRSYEIRLEGNEEGEGKVWSFVDFPISFDVAFELRTLLKQLEGAREKTGGSCRTVRWSSEEFDFYFEHFTLCPYTQIAQAWEIIEMNTGFNRDAVSDLVHSEEVAPVPEEFLAMLAKLERGRYYELVVPELYEADQRRNRLRVEGIEC